MGSACGEVVRGTEAPRRAHHARRLRRTGEGIYSLAVGRDRPAAWQDRSCQPGYRPAEVFPTAISGATSWPRGDGVGRALKGDFNSVGAGEQGNRGDAQEATLSQPTTRAATSRRERRSRGETGTLSGPRSQGPLRMASRSQKMTRQEANGRGEPSPRYLTRRELHELVWSEPIRTVSRQLGISDVGLAKACRRAHVPVPERGHWQKRRAGKKSSQTALPPRPLGATDDVFLGGG